MCVDEGELQKEVEKPWESKGIWVTIELSYVSKVTLEDLHPPPQTFFLHVSPVYPGFRKQCIKEAAFFVTYLFGGRIPSLK